MTCYYWSLLYSAVLCSSRLTSTHVTCDSDLGNQHNNDFYRDQIYDNPSALCLALWVKNWSGVGGWVSGWGTDAPNRLFTKGAVPPRYPLLVGFLLCLRSSGSKFNASAVNYLLFLVLFFYASIKLYILNTISLTWYSLFISETYFISAIMC